MNKDKWSEREAKQLKQPLKIEIDETKDGSYSSPKRSNPTEKLIDALSPNFAALSEKRRCVQPGEYRRLLDGRKSPSQKPSTSMDSPGGASDSSIHSCSSADETNEVGFEGSSLIETTRGQSPSKNPGSSRHRDADEETPVLRTSGRPRRSSDAVRAASGGSGMRHKSTNESSTRRKGRNSRLAKELRKVGVGSRTTQNSASAALFGTPVKEIKTEPAEPSPSPPPTQKRVRTPRLPHSPPFQPRKILRNTSQSASESSDERRATPISMKPDTSKKGAKQNVQKRERSPPEELNESFLVEPDSERVFMEITQKNQEELDSAMTLIQKEMKQHKTSEIPLLPKAIRIGKYEIKSWYSSPFPTEYAHAPVVFICEFCLKYVRTYELLVQHIGKCPLYHPPGNEIYRSNGHSVFEVDGALAKTYCQNLCLLSKLFIDHKTLYYDVEPFLFYVLTQNDENGHHFVGYFSKEKNSVNWNLSCIATLPCYQKSGYGRFLIAFSYLLTRRMGTTGSPERPLSRMGLLAYAPYWREAVLEWTKKHRKRDSNDKFTVNAIASATGIRPSDIIFIMDHMGWLSSENRDSSPSSRSIEVTINWHEVDEHWEQSKKPNAFLKLDELALQTFYR
ncbi:unnamed protein product, partial [Mesorhabditis spiculigera]